MCYMCLACSTYVYSIIIMCLKSQLQPPPYGVTYKINIIMFL